MIYDIIIVGLGIAGINASIYAKRSGLNVLVFEQETPGGLLNKIDLIENFPGYINISGPDLATKLYEQFSHLNIPLKIENVLKIENDKNYKSVITKNNIYKSKTVIIATGRRPKKLNIVNEEKLLGKGISYCHLCDGNLYKNKPVAVVGGGNSAVSGAIYLSNICSKVYLIVRKPYLIADKIYQQKLVSLENVEILYENNIKSFVEKDGVLNKVILSDRELSINCVFIDIGYEPNNILCKDLNILNDNGHIDVDCHMQTRIPGIFACGDIVNKSVYQLITASSDGAMAAVSASKYINLKKL